MSGLKFSSEVTSFLPDNLSGLKKNYIQAWFYILFGCFYYWLWTTKCGFGRDSIKNTEVLNNLCGFQSVHGDYVEWTTPKCGMWIPSEGLDLEGITTVTAELLRKNC